jgi:hypothetical protein
MASQFQPIAALITDDTGTPDNPNGDGTQINSTLFAAIDAILNEILTRATKTVGGVWTWETAGSHTITGSNNAANELAIRNTGSNAASIAQLRIGNNSASDLGLLFTTSSANANPNRVVLQANGAGGLQLTVGTSAPIYISSTGGGLAFPGNSADTFVIGGFGIVPTTAVHNNAGQGVGSNTGCLIGANISTWNTATGASYGTQANASLPSWALDLGGARGNDGAPWNADAFSILRRGAASTWSRSMTLALLGGFPNLKVGRADMNGIGGVSIGEGTASPVSGQILFGGDGSGWELRFGRNNAGTVTHYWKLTDSGHLIPVTNNTSNMGESALRVGTIFATNVNTANVAGTGNFTANTVHPQGGDNTGTIGASGLRWAAFYAMDANFNDVSFDNDWSITEGEKVGLGHGLAFVRRDQELCMFIDEHGTFYVNETKPLSDIHRFYKKMTKQERMSGTQV